MNKAQLDELKRKLPRDWATIIAKEMGVTPATVWNAMKLRTNRADIIERVIQLGNATHEATIATQKKIKKVLNKLS